MTKPTDAKSDPIAQLFTRADADGDGSVTLDELGALVKARIAKRVAVRHAQLDRNHDGRVTRNEVPAMNAARFARFDSNGDGGFTLAELSQIMTIEVAERLQAVFADLDSNQDARCSLAELEAHHRAATLAKEALARNAARPAEPPSRSEQARRNGLARF